MQSRHTQALNMHTSPVLKEMIQPKKIDYKALFHLPVNLQRLKVETSYDVSILHK